MNRQALRSWGWFAALTAPCNYVVNRYVLDREDPVGLAITIVVVGLAVWWLLGRIPEGWPRREPRPWESLPPEMDKVRELAQAGRRLQAMRMYRDLTGADVATSRFVVNSLAAGVPDGGHGQDRDQAAQGG
ncbi:hypothetical protein KZZ52_57350 [Dactylosporangium sp. AC04546]|uniref:hypothetical protein n=1 Tax=Dactylosporangium sp. AC04546 TaxID=2862460 RepID=UPI001EDD778E|nr:hypothetical protein [Dactylosporangium sp. AC04546]WVK83377.1 hypothetical protein KZZ52_57350 [Dactylosporangium sp. AC04546]